VSENTYKAWHAGDCPGFSKNSLRSEWLALRKSKIQFLLDICSSKDMNSPLYTFVHLFISSRLSSHTKLAPTTMMCRFRLAFLKPTIWPRGRRCVCFSEKKKTSVSPIYAFPFLRCLFVCVGDYVRIYAKRYMGKALCKVSAQINDSSCLRDKKGSLV
jgi:hypothetical protein